MALQSRTAAIAATYILFVLQSTAGQDESGGGPPWTCAVDCESQKKKEGNLLRYCVSECEDHSWMASTVVAGNVGARESSDVAQASFSVTLLVTAEVSAIVSRFGTAGPIYSISKNRTSCNPLLRIRCLLIAPVCCALRILTLYRFAERLCLSINTTLNVKWMSILNLRALALAVLPEG